MNAQEFWLVWNPHGRNPTMRHEDWRSAEAEARRLAAMNHGQRFYVLHAGVYFERNDVQRVELGDGIPF